MDWQAFRKKEIDDLAVMLLEKHGYERLMSWNPDAEFKEAIDKAKRSTEVHHG